MVFKEAHIYIKLRGCATHACADLIWWSDEPLQCKPGTLGAHCNKLRYKYSFQEAYRYETLDVQRMCNVDIIWNEKLSVAIQGSMVIELYKAHKMNSFSHFQLQKIQRMQKLPHLTQRKASIRSPHQVILLTAECNNCTARLTDKATWHHFWPDVQIRETWGTMI